MHPQVVTKDDDVDVGSHRTEEPLQVPQVDLHQPIQETVHPFWLQGQQHQEVIHAKEKLAPLVQVAPKQAQDRPIGGLAQSFRTNRKPGKPRFIETDGSRRRAERRPHHLLHGVLEMREVLARIVLQGEVRLLEVEAPGLLNGDECAVGIINVPVIAHLHRVDERRDLAWRAIR